MVSVPPTKRLRTVLDEELKEGETLNTVFKAEQSYAADSIPDGLQVGKREWTATSSHAAGLGQQVHNLSQQVQALQQAVSIGQQTQEADALVFGAQFVSNVAAQALLFACESQPRDDPPNRRFRRMAKAGSERLTAYLAAWPFRPSMDDFGEAADAVINRRNSFLHYSSLHNLEEDASAALQLLARHPSLRNKCKQESSVLDTFQELKAAFELR